MAAAAVERGTTCCNWVASVTPRAVTLVALFFSAVTVLGVVGSVHYTKLGLHALSRTSYMVTCTAGLVTLVLLVRLIINKCSSSQRKNSFAVAPPQRTADGSPPSPLQDPATTAPLPLSQPSVVPTDAQLMKAQRPAVRAKFLMRYLASYRESILMRINMCCNTLIARSGQCSQTDLALLREHSYFTGILLNQLSYEQVQIFLSLVIHLDTMTHLPLFSENITCHFTDTQLMKFFTKIFCVAGSNDAAHMSAFLSHFSTPLREFTGTNTSELHNTLITSVLNDGRLPLSMHHQRSDVRHQSETRGRQSDEMRS